MTKQEQKTVRRLAAYYLKSYRESQPSCYQLKYLKSTTGPVLSSFRVGVSRLTDEEELSYHFALRYLSRFDSMCEVLNIFTGISYDSLYESFGILCGGYENV